MNKVQQWLQLFEKTSCFYRQMFMLPLWHKHPNHQTDILASLAIFLEGYAFERQGRRPDYSHVAVDSLFYCSQQNEPLNPNCVWKKFSELLKDQQLNHKNNPLYPSNNPDNITGISNKPSIIEVITQFQDNTLSKHIHDLLRNDIKQPLELLKSMRGTGDKIASFYLRDLVIILNVDLSKNQDRYLLQPIDVWVERTVKNLAEDEGMDKQQISGWIVDNSSQFGLNPEHINMGIWFFGALIAKSEYRLKRSLTDILTANSLMDDFCVEITNISQNCQTT